MKILNETRLARAAVLLTAVAVGVSSATAPLSSSIGFVGPVAVPGRSDRGSAARKSEGTANAPVAQGSSSKGATEESPLARKMYSRRADRARSRPTAGTTVAVETPRRQRQGASEDTDKGGDVGNVLRMEVAQRMKEMKLVTRSGVGPLAPVGGGLSGPEALSAAPLLGADTTAALEGQIALLTKRIKSIKDYLQTTPTDAVSRKGLVVLVKLRRTLLETLRHRDNESWLATTESLGLRQRPDAAGATASTAEQKAVDARRARRRDRGRRRRREIK